MPDSALNRRSEALGGWKANNASFGHQIIPRTISPKIVDELDYCPPNGWPRFCEMGSNLDENHFARQYPQVLL